MLKTIEFTELKTTYILEKDYVEGVSLMHGPHRQKEPLLRDNTYMKL